MLKGRKRRTIRRKNKSVERWIAEEKALKSDEIYKQVVENTSDYVALIDERGRYIYVNPAHTKMGYANEDLLGKVGMELVHPEDRERLRSLLVTYVKKLAAAKISDLLGIKREISAMCIYYRFRDKYGNWHDIETTPDIIRYPGGIGYAGLLVSKDITERRRAEEALKESEETYRDLFENANDAICILDSDLNYTDANKKAVELLGYSRRELLNMSILDIIPPNQVPRSKFEFDKLRKKGSHGKFIGKVRAKDGRSIDVEISSSAIIKDGKVIGSRNIIRDITDRNRMEEEMRVSEEKYRVLMEDASDAILLFDTQGNLQETNKKAEELLGYPKKELLNIHITQIYPKEELGKGVAAFKEVLLNGSGFLSNGLILRKDGKTVLVDITWGLIRFGGERKAVQGIFRDVTERRRAEEEIQDRERFLANVFSSIQDGISVLDSELNILRVNPAMERWYAHEMPLIGKKCYRAYHEQSEPCRVCPSMRTYETGEAAYEVVPKKGEGGHVVGWLDLYTFPMIDGATGKIKGVIEYVRDITEIKKAEELRLENMRLTDANRAKSAFLATMSHELRTPLNSIIGFTELMKQKIPGELNIKQEHYLDNVLASGRHLLGLINDILDLSKVEAGKIELVLEKISIPEIIEEAMILIQERADKNNIVLRKEIDPRLEFIEADRQRIKQILFNLLSNAVKFCKPGGGEVTITAKKEGETAKLSISDTGIGIKEQDLVKLFREFDQLESARRYGGTGLGLAISKKLVELHGGSILVESRFGEGSTFTVILPLAAQEK